MAQIPRLGFLAVTAFCSPAVSQTAGALAPLRGIDVLRDSAAEGQGLQVGAESIAAIDANIRSLRLSPGALATYHYVSDVIEHVDLGDVFESPMPVKVAPNERLFTLTGRNATNFYVIDAPRRGISELDNVDPFEFSAEMRVLRNRNPIPGEERGYGLKPTLEMNSGRIDHHVVLRLIGGVLRMISPVNLELLRGERSGSDAIMEEFATTLPGFHGLLTRYIDIQPTIVTEEAKGGAVSHVKATAVFRIERLRSRYPALADYLERLMSIAIDLRAVQRLPSGRSIALVDVSTKTRSIRIEYYTKDGKLVPFDAAKKLAPESAIDVASLQSLRSDLVVGLKASVMGLRFSVKDVVLRMAYEDDPVAVFASRLTALPTPKVEGRLLGILPGWAIDLTIPGTIEGYARTFCQGLLHANHGEGSYARLTVDTQAPATQLTGQAGTEIVDNFFLGIGLRIVQSYLWPDPDVIDDGWKLLGSHVAALDKDMKQLLARAAAPKLVH